MFRYRHTVDDERLDKWRQEQQEKRQAFMAQQRARMKADPRVQAMKQAQKDRARAHRQKVAAERKQRRQERVDGERADRGTTLLQLVRRGSDD